MSANDTDLMWEASAGVWFPFILRHGGQSAVNKHTDDLSVSLRCAQVNRLTWWSLPRQNGGPDQQTSAVGAGHGAQSSDSHEVHYVQSRTGWLLFPRFIQADSIPDSVSMTTGRRVREKGNLRGHVQGEMSSVTNWSDDAERSHIHQEIIPPTGQWHLVTMAPVRGRD